MPPMRACVAAIHFGSDRVMVAFSFYNEYKSEPTHCSLKRWHDATSHNVIESVPTSILIAPDNTMEAFGYDAEEKYKELMDNGRHKKFHYFKNFVSLISNEQSGTHFIKDEMDRCLPAASVLSMAIRILTNDLVDYAKSKSSVLDMSDFYWVLTVPVTWSLRTKELTKSAALMAGIKSDHFTIIPESGAVLHYVRHISLERKGGSISGVPLITAGSRCMLIAADSSISFTVYKVTINGKIQEGQPTTCEARGAQLVKSAFDDLMSEIFSHEIYEEFKTSEPLGYKELMLDFEIKFLRHFDTSGADYHNMSISELLGMYKNIKGETIRKTIDSSLYKDKVLFFMDKIRFQREVIVELFDASIQDTIKQIECIRKDKEIKTIIMFGRLSESTIFQNGIESNYAGSGVDVIIPDNPSTVAAKGAVMFGHSQPYIEEPKQSKQLFSMK